MTSHPLAPPPPPLQTGTRDVSRKSHDENCCSCCYGKLDECACCISVGSGSLLLQRQVGDFECDYDGANDLLGIHRVTREQGDDAVCNEREGYGIGFTRLAISTTTTRPVVSGVTLSHAHSTTTHRKVRERKDKPVVKPLTLSYAIDQLVSPTQPLSPADLQPHLYKVEKQPCPTCQSAKEARRNRKWTRWLPSCFGYGLK